MEILRRGNGTPGTAFPTVLLQFKTASAILTAGSRFSWRKGRLARYSRRDSPAPAPYTVRFVAANSAFTVFRSAKRRKPLCCRSSSPKVLRLSGSPLNHWARSQATPRPTVESAASGRIISAHTMKKCKEKAPDWREVGSFLINQMNLFNSVKKSDYFLRETAAAAATETTAIAATTPITDSAPVLGFSSPLEGAAGTSRTTLY